MPVSSEGEDASEQLDIHRQLSRVGLIILSPDSGNSASKPAVLTHSITGEVVELGRNFLATSGLQFDMSKKFRLQLVGGALRLSHGDDTMGRAIDYFRMTAYESSGGLWYWLRGSEKVFFNSSSWCPSPR